MNFRDNAISIFDFDLLHLQLNTPLFMLALVLVVMFALNKLLFQPVLRTLEERKTYLDGLGATAGEQREAIARLADSYEADLEKVRDKVAQVRAEARKETQEQIDAAIHHARQQAGQELSAALAELEGEVRQAREALGPAARDLAEKTANRILSA